MRLVRTVYVEFESSPHPAAERIAVAHTDGSNARWVARLPLPGHNPAAGLGLKLSPRRDSARIHYLDPETGEVHQVKESVHPENEDVRTPVWLHKFREIKPLQDDGGRETHFLYFSGKVLEIIQSEVALAMPLPVDVTGAIKLPEDALRLSIELSEILIDLITLTYGSTKREVSNPRIPIALVADSQEEFLWLERTNGIRDLDNIEIQFEWHYLFDLNRIKEDSFSDRHGGLQLLTDALSQESAAAKYREIIRYFEFAFRIGSGRLAGPLIKFLRGSEEIFEAKEIYSWLGVRGAVIHGDSREDDVILNVDVRPMIGRMELAAIDILLHKKEWRNNSSDRRTVDVSKKGEPGFGEPLIERRQARVTGWHKFGSAPSPILPLGKDIPELMQEGWWQKAYKQGKAAH